MDSNSSERDHFKNLNTHLANERTRLSEQRTALAFVTFGITLNRFSLFLISHLDRLRSHEALLLVQSKYVGLGMVFLGLLMLLWSATNYRRVLRAIETQSYSPPSTTFGLLTTLFIALAIAGAIWMIIG
jgi:putative membrane protein